MTDSTTSASMVSIALPGWPGWTFLPNTAARGRQPTDFDDRIISLGLNYYLTRAIVFKAEYSFVQEGERKEKKPNDLIGLQAAVRF